MKTRGQIAYDAYMDFSGGVSLVSGHDLPKWEQQDPKIRMAWEYAAQAVIESEGPSV